MALLAIWQWSSGRLSNRKNLQNKADTTHHRFHFKERDMADKVQSIIEEIKTLSLLEASQLVKGLEEAFGVSAAAATVAAAAGPAAGGGAAAAPAEEKTEFNVILTVAPASVNFFLIFSASSLLTPSLIGFGAPSTRSFASFKPRLVTSRTALITLILLAPTPVSTTVNSVFSSGAAAAAAPAPPPATITGAAAAAETPRRVSSFFTSAAASSSDNPTI